MQPVVVVVVVVVLFCQQKSLSFSPKVYTSFHGNADGLMVVKDRI